MNLPNKLSMLRLFLIPVFALVFYWGFNGHYIVACVVFALAAFTDFLDGFIARKYSLVTDLGKFLDSSADKVLVLTALVLICDMNIFPSVAGGVGVAIILAREIMVSCLRMVAASKGFVMAADKLGKLKTVTQDVTIIIALITAHCHSVDSLKYITYALFALSVLLTIASGINYLIRNRKVLSQIEK